ncbi:extracellular solute-binding protein [Gordonia polyisoprenivorans]|uniref:extracellular solute-binding protein n=1 Tax=Gordonia polyisoprenivorans TaxID=84595 RepID=UPI001FCBF36B|nr:extracellular solute-binding protein [Gordonia polyisoprenivorans]
MNETKDAPSRAGIRPRGGRRRRGTTLAALTLAVALSAAGCSGSSGDDSTGTSISYYVNADSVTSSKEAAATCSKDSGGRYHIDVVTLPKSADNQRLQMARRLAGGDKSLDLLSLDVVWTAEFANAGWLRPVPDSIAQTIEQTTLAGPLATALWKTAADPEARLYAIPAWTNTQLLWYRPDLMERYLGSATPPTTWDEILADTEKIRAAGGPSWIMVQGKQYEGLMVWFNSVLASAGGAVLDPANPTHQTLTDTPEHRGATIRALTVIKQVATAPGHDPSISNSDESSDRLGMESGKAAFELNWPFVYPSMRSNSAAGSVPFLPEMTRYASQLAEGAPDPSPAELAEMTAVVAKKFAFAPYPGVISAETARTTPGGTNIAVASTSTHPELAWTAAQCLTNAASQRTYAVDGGNPPTLSAVYDDPAFKEVYPMGDIIRDQLTAQHSSPRPASPQYQTISTLITAKLSPVGAWDPAAKADDLATAVDNALRGEGLVP